MPTEVQNSNPAYPNLTALAAIDPNSKVFTKIDENDISLTCGQRAIIKSAFLRHLIAFFARLAFAIPYVILKAHEFVVGTDKVKGSELAAKVETFINAKTRTPKTKKKPAQLPSAAPKIPPTNCDKRDSDKIATPPRTFTIPLPVKLPAGLSVGLPNSVEVVHGYFVAMTCWFNTVMQMIANTQLEDLLVIGIKDLLGQEANGTVLHKDVKNIMIMASAALELCSLMKAEEPDAQAIDEKKRDLYIMYISSKTDISLGDQDDANNFLITLLRVLDSDLSRTGMIARTYYEDVDGNELLLDDSNTQPEGSVIFTENYPTVTAGIRDIVGTTKSACLKPTRFEFTEKEIFMHYLEHCDDDEIKAKYADLSERPEYSFKEGRPLHRELERDLFPDSCFMAKEAAFLRLQLVTKKAILRKTHNSIPTHSKALVITTQGLSKTLEQPPEETISVTDPNGNAMTFELVATAHHGGAQAGGHYTAYTKLQNGTWYMRSDSEDPEPVAHPSETFSTLVYMKSSVTVTT